MVEEMSIGQVARQVGIRASAIRYYEQAGLLPTPRRRSGQRRYGPAIVDRLALIEFAQQAGFTISEIRTLFEGFEEETPMSLRWQTLAREKLVEVDALIERAERMRHLLDQALTCGCLRPEDCARVISTRRC
jgi:MerR family transcriptional regulator, redox-sensitive transcriptional activator SoxR